MPYKFLNASMESLTNPDTTFKRDFQELLNAEFYNSTDAYVIQEESPFASGELVDVDVRINHVINTRTGLNRGDDFKTILFKDITHATGVGYLYYFDDNYWIVINSEKIKNLAASAVVRRCNNTLRWIDLDSGKVNSVPCAIDYLVKQNRDYSTAGSSLVNPSGTIEATTQFNATSNKIKASQRFLFGNSSNWQGYKIQGGGINNFIGLKTSDNNSTGLIIFSMAYAQKGDSEIDDLTNGIADVGEFLYVLNIQSNLTLESGKNFILIPSLTLNGISSTAGLTWTTNKPSIATVDSSGLVTPVSIGSCVITCSMTGNPLVTDSCSVIVSASTVDNYEIKITPANNFVLEGTTQNFLVKLWKNGLVQGNTFVFDLLGSNVIPAENFNLTFIDGNNFSIQNIKKFTGSSLPIKCTSGTHEKTLNISLKGIW